MVRIEDLTTHSYHKGVVLDQLTLDYSVLSVYTRKPKTLVPGGFSN